MPFIPPSGFDKDALESTPEIMLVVIVTAVGAWLLFRVIAKWRNDRNRELQQLEDMAVRYSHKKSK